VSLEVGRLIAVPMLSVASIVIVIAAGGLAFKPRLFPRKAWLALVALGLVGAVALAPFTAIEVENPLAGPPDETTATEIIGELVGNLHTALQLRDESKLRESLAINVAASQLDDVLPELQRAFAIRIQGGGAAQLEGIDAVEVRNIEQRPDGGFQALAAWSANASAGHWGHLHRRRIRFDALIELVPADGAWKLAAVTVVNLEQES
jgi:hypothetical protein